MGSLFFDDSKHDAAAGFSLGAFVYTRDDPTAAVNEALTSQGLSPGVDEFKSSSYMGHSPAQARLREDLRGVLWRTCRLGVVVVPSATELGIEALRLLQRMLNHPDLAHAQHEVYFDEGIFTNPTRGYRTAASVGRFERCDLNLEQSSTGVPGIQLADLAAHTCSVMLRESLGVVNKTVKAGDNSGYDPDLDISIGFELWASVRYNFLAERPHLAEVVEGELQPVANVRPWGLHISASASGQLRRAAEDRFGTMYLGCIH